MTRITFLIVDTPSENASLATEHGLSLFVETEDTAFVFDTGATGAAFENAAKLGIDLADTAFAVISHGHYDHAGGFPKLLEYAHIPKLYTGPGFWREKYAVGENGDKYTYLGAGQHFKFLREHEVAQTVVEDFEIIGKGAWLVGNFPRLNAFETIPARFVVGHGKDPDYFEDEICLVLKEGDGLALVTGCAHPGILNMVSAVTERLGRPIYSVIGGTHLVEAGEGRIDVTLKKFAELGIKRLHLCHCSGEKVFERAASLNIAISRIGTGDIVEIQ